MRYLVGGFELDIRSRTISGPDGSVHVEPQVFDVLTHLIEHRERAVGKTELLDEIWGDQFVSESALTTRIKSGRAALGDSGREQNVIRTVHGFGYQFVADVTVVDADVTRPSGGQRADWSASLPRFQTLLRGREEDLTELNDLLESHQLVTLLGPGGTGKTRLAVETLRALPDDGRGRAFVDLASTRDPGAVAATFASTLNIDTGQRAGVLDAVCEFLDADPHVLVVDNCEHLLDAAADAIAAVVTRAGATSIVATSREPLGVPAERLLRLGPLPVVGRDGARSLDDLEQNPATALFLDRTRLAVGDLDLSEREVGLIAELCRELDGLPLAVELAAGRMSAFDLDDLVDLLDRRLDLLGDRSSARDDRHRTLRATVGWSYDLLADPEQRLFRALAVLPGGVTLDGIEWMSTRLGLGITGVDAVGRLVDASLLTRTRAPSGSRYSMLETLRAFGMDRLSDATELAEVSNEAARYTLELLGRIDTGFDSPDEAVFADRMQRELPNVRAARSTFIEQGRLDELLDLCRHLARWARLRTASEVWSWYDDLLERIPEDDPRRPAALALHAQAAWRRGDIVTAKAEAADAHLRAGDDWTRFQALGELGAARLFGGELAEAQHAWTEQSRIRHDGMALAMAAVAAAYSGDIDTARSLIADGRTSTKMPASAASWLDYCEAETEHTVGLADPATLERAIDRAQRLDCSFIVGVATVTLATVLEARGDVAGAAGRYRDLISHWFRTGSWTQQWTTLRHVAELLEDSHPETALLILRAANEDATSAPALVGDAGQHLASLERRLEEQVAHHDLPSMTRVDVAERARAALAETAHLTGN